ncbi:MAG: hypothetical protein V6004_01360 [Candidatus Dasytiphilus stammeri]
MNHKFHSLLKESEIKNNIYETLYFLAFHDFFYDLIPETNITTDIKRVVLRI